jgi:hypothetical protein
MTLPAYNDDQDGMMQIELVCPTCNKPKKPNCDGEGWLEPIGPKSDGSYITSRRCWNAR